MLKFLEGKKTYITGFIMFVLGGLYAIREQVPVINQIPEEYWQQAMEWAKVGGAALLAIFLRLGVKKDA